MSAHAVGGPDGHVTSGRGPSTPAAPSHATHYRALLPVLGAAASAVVVTLLEPTLGTALLVALGLAIAARHRIAPALLVITLVAPWGSLVNVLMGGRLVPLGIDLAILGCAATLATRDGRRWWWPSAANAAPDRPVQLALLSTLGMLVIGALFLLHPRGHGLVTAAEGYRTFYLPMLGVMLGLAATRQAPAFARHFPVALMVSVGLVGLMGIRQAIAMSSIDWAIIEASQAGIYTFRATGQGILRAFSPMPGPFHFGLLMTIGLVCVTSAALERPRLAYLLVPAIALPALVLNATRLNWLGAAASLTVVLLALLRPGTLGRVLLRLAAALVVIGLAGWQILQAAAFAHLSRFAATLANPTAESSFTYRVAGWLYDIGPAIARHPWIGYGTGMAKDGTGGFTSHNLLLKVLIEGGLVLFLPYMLAFAAALVALWRRRHHPTARAALGLIVGIHAGGMFGNQLDTYPANLFFWILLGAGLGVAPMMATPRDAGAPPSST